MPASSNHPHLQGNRHSYHPGQYEECRHDKRRMLSIAFRMSLRTRSPSSYPFNRLTVFCSYRFIVFCFCFSDSPIHRFTDSPSFVFVFSDSPIHPFTHSPIHPFTVFCFHRFTVFCLLPLHRLQEVRHDHQRNGYKKHPRPSRRC